MTLFRSTAIIGFFTLLSRVFGFVRDVLVANVLGASWLSDAFFVAFKLPNFFRRLFGEGAFSAAFVPLYAGKLAAQGKRDAMQFAADAMGFLTVALLLLNAVMLLIMPWALLVFAPGFVEDAEKFDTTVTLARIAFPYIFFISLVALLSGILNSIEKFAAVAATPILLNLCLIVAMLFFADSLQTPAHVLAFGVFVAGAVQLLWLVVVCRKYGVCPRLIPPKMNDNVREMLRLIAPAAFGAGVAQINLLVDVVLASTLVNGVSYLYYADRLNELPLGVIGVAIGTALLPMLSKQFRTGDIAAAHVSLNRAIELAMLLCLPAAIALILLADPLITLLFQHGAFSRIDTMASFPALIAYASGLPAFILIKLFAPGFFARKDTKTPVKIAVLCVVLNLVLNLILMQYMAHVGLALATSIAAWVNAGLLGYILMRRGGFAPNLALVQRLIRIFIVCALLACALLLVRTQLHDYPSYGLWQQIGIMAAIVIGFKALYLALSFKLHAVNREDVRLLLRR